MTQELEELRTLLLKCYDWDQGYEENPYRLWVDQRIAENKPALQLSFTEFLKEHLQRVGVL